MKASEELIAKGIERCIECNNPVGDDWEYSAFSNKTTTTCPQCGEIYYLPELPEATEK